MAEGAYLPTTASSAEIDAELSEIWYQEQVARQRVAQMRQSAEDRGRKFARPQFQIERDRELLAGYEAQAARLRAQAELLEKAAKDLAPSAGPLTRLAEPYIP